jgi:DNA-binding NtrC family response regulator
MAFEDSKQSILIVEDDDIIAELIVQIIEELGYKTVLKKTGHAAISWLKEHHTDLMILDYSLPDMNAAILTSLLSHEKSIPPFVVSTGMGDELIAVDMMKRGARDYLVKSSQFLTNLPLVVNRIMRELSTEKKLYNTQAELLDSKEILRTIIDSIPDIICYKDYKSG